MSEGRNVMALLQVSIARSRTDYDRVVALLGDTPVPGRLLHAAAERPDGTVQIVDVFASQEALDAFGTQIIPALDRVGVLDRADAPRPTPLETFDLRLGQPAT
jgi:hypothetical protein